jgi:hypothetical protein
MPIVVRIDPERLQEMRERSQFYRGAATELKKAACRIAARGEAWGASGRKVFLADLAQEMQRSVQRMSSLLVSFHRLGWLELSRADLVSAMDAAKLVESEIVDGFSSYHFIVADDCRRS